MERKIFQFLLHWKNEEFRKPLVIYGSKQVGKTYSALKFGETNYKNTIYIDVSNNTKFIFLHVLTYYHNFIINRYYYKYKCKYFVI